MIKNDMTLQQAIHIIAEEATRYKRLAADLAETPLDMDGKCLEHAKHYKEKAQAMDMLLRVARIWAQEAQE